MTQQHFAFARLSAIAVGFRILLTFVLAYFTTEI